MLVQDVECSMFDDEGGKIGLYVDPRLLQGAGGGWKERLECLKPVGVCTSYRATLRPALWTASSTFPLSDTMQVTRWSHCSSSPKRFIRRVELRHFASFHPLGRSRRGDDRR